MVPNELLEFTDQIIGDSLPTKRIVAAAHIVMIAPAGDSKSQITLSTGEQITVQGAYSHLRDVLGVKEITPAVASG